MKILKEDINMYYIDKSLSAKKFRLFWN